jgi:hypothetical protein
MTPLLNMPPPMVPLQAFGGPSLLMHSAPSVRSTRDVVVGWAAGCLAPIAFLLQPMMVARWYSPTSWTSSTSAGAYLSASMDAAAPPAYASVVSQAMMPAAGPVGALVAAQPSMHTMSGDNSLASQLASQLEAELFAATQSRVEVQPVLDSLTTAAATAGAHALAALPLPLLQARARALGVEHVVLATRGQSDSNASFVLVGSPVPSHSFEVMSGGGRSSRSSQPAGWAAGIGTLVSTPQAQPQPHHQSYVGLSRVGLGRIGEEEGASGQFAVTEHASSTSQGGQVSRRASPTTSSATLASSLVRCQALTMC